MKYQSLFSGKNIISLSSADFAEFTHIMESVIIL